jgi:hypothetical protein
MTTANDFARVAVQNRAMSPDSPGETTAKPPPAILPPPPFSVRYHPVSLALWRAMQMPAAAVLGPPPTNATALDAAVRTLFRLAITGNAKAFALIADRIEGRVGLRSDDAEPDDPAIRQRVQATMESLVRFMVERAANAPAMGADDGLAENPRECARY